MDENRRNVSDELNISDMFWQFVYNWRKVLILAVALGLIFGGVILVTRLIEINDPDYLEDAERKNRITSESYELQINAYENRISNLQLQIDKKEESKKNSIMLRMDPYNTYKKTVTYYIDTGYQIMPDKTYQDPNKTSSVTSGYINALENLNLDSYLATPEEPDLTAQNPFPNGEYSLLRISDKSGGSLIYLTIKGESQERIEQIFDAVKQMMAEQGELLRTAISEHTVSILAEEDEVVTDTGLRLVQNDFIDNYSELVNTMMTTKGELEALEKTEPVLIGTSMLSVIIAFIKYGIIGGVIGVVLGFIFWGLIRCLRGKVNSVEELRQKYDAVMLAAIPKESVKRSKLDKKIIHHLGIRKKLNYKRGLDLAAANIRLYLPDDNDLLLIGTVEEEKLAKLSKDLSELLPERDLIVGGDVNISAKAVNAVKEGHTVICVEELNESSYRYINHELEAMDKAREQEVYFIVVG